MHQLLLRHATGALLALALLGTAFGIAFAGAEDENGSATAWERFCEALGEEFNATSLVSGDVCDVVLVRTSPTIKGHDGRTLNEFTLMNSVLEFTRKGPTGGTIPRGEVYVMGDFALLETEVNAVIQEMKENDWTVTGMHNHMIMETPKMSFVHWEVTDEPDDIIQDVRKALASTTIPAGSGIPSLPNTGGTTTPATGTPTTTPTTTSSTTHY